MYELLSGKPLIGSLRDLEYRLEVRRDELREILNSRPSLYRPFKIPKKQHPYPGKKRLDEAAAKPPKFRQIENPVMQLKDIQTRILKRILFRVLLPDYMFGAVAGRTLTKHAERHVPNQNTTVVRMDISSYYPNVTCAHVYFVWNVFLGCPPPIASILTELTTFNYHLPQGAPTSPALANIYLASIYAPVCLASKSAELTITTWVDDLIFSGPAARTVMNTVRSVLASNGFRIAPEKREILGPKDEKVITGARLGRFQVRAPHRKMSELRAAIHRLATGAVPHAELANYRLNLSSRIAHIASLNVKDAEKLRRQAKALRVSLN